MSSIQLLVPETVPVPIPCSPPPARSGKTRPGKGKTHHKRKKRRSRQRGRFRLTTEEWTALAKASVVIKFWDNRYPRGKRFLAFRRHRRGVLCTEEDEIGQLKRMVLRKNAHIEYCYLYVKSVSGLWVYMERYDPFLLQWLPPADRSSGYTR
ncbi:hypothetical protein SAMN05421823_11912 [Catalinimonas alkaloidigena]|uniref:Uncharacterized protein n=1 Tax=Catalinimonas alkaloidigena TaxID=1075417 RepID=A0A1G9V4E6_9BACT|nr:hypothetical protein [Catalinimonas alkaloidigena]SDM66990.1 hypothetical protein SAMN05421823_11912 [Catalinimonas alkaloidigena]